MINKENVKVGDLVLYTGVYTEQHVNLVAEIVDLEKDYRDLGLGEAWVLLKIISADKTFLPMGRTIKEHVSNWTLCGDEICSNEEVLSDWNATCKICGSPAYSGFLFVECSQGC